MDVSKTDGEGSEGGFGRGKNISKIYFMKKKKKKPLDKNETNKQISKNNNNNIKLLPSHLWNGHEQSTEFLKSGSK